MSVPFIEKLNGIAIVKIFQGNQCLHNATKNH